MCWSRPVKPVRSTQLAACGRDTAHGSLVWTAATTFAVNNIAILRAAMIGASPDHIFEVLHAAGPVALRFQSVLAGLGTAFQEVHFYTRSRIKAYGSITKKIEDHQRTDPEYSFSSVDDVIGVRVVTLDDEDLWPALHQILRAIEVGRSLDQPLFSGATVWDAVQRAKFYKRVAEEGRPYGQQNCFEPSQDADVYARCADQVKTRIAADVSDPTAARALQDKFRVIEPTPQLYSSAHIYLNTFSYTLRPSKVVQIPMEIQIRTAVEDIWSEVNHKLVYKGANGAWSLDIQTARNNLERNSATLKRTFNSLPYYVRDFRALHRQFSKLVTEFQRPPSTYRSLVMSLVSTAAGRLIGFIGGKLAEYDNHLLKLSQFDNENDHEAAGRELERCFKTLRTIADGLASEKRLHDSHSPEYIACDECQKLLSFESVRLKVVGVTQFECRYSNRTLKRVGNDRQKFLDRLFDDLSAYENHIVNLRPEAVLAFWKYEITQSYNRSDALRFLDRSYRQLASDTSLPVWSIYRIVVPRRKSMELHENINTALARPHLIPDNSSNGFQARYKYIIEDFREAMELAKEAYQLSFNEDTRRGDILFGFQQDERIVDGNNMIALYLRGYRIFRYNIFAGGIVDDNEIAEVCAVIRLRMFSVRLSERERQQLHMNITEVESILESKANNQER